MEQNADYSVRTVLHSSSGVSVLLQNRPNNNLKPGDRENVDNLVSGAMPFNRMATEYERACNSGVWITHRKSNRVCSHDITARRRRSEIFFWGLNFIFMQILPSVALCKYGI